MRLTKCLCFLALCVPFTLIATGCGDDEAGQMATDAELAEYGKEAAKGGPLEGMTLGGGDKKSE